jgi:hypothetical protein
MELSLGGEKGLGLRTHWAEEFARQELLTAPLNALSS